MQIMFIDHEVLFNLADFFLKVGLNCNHTGAFVESLNKT